MSERIPEINGASIALTGSFNPKIFQPEWFARQGLLPAEEAEGAQVRAIVPQICQFETERFYVQVTDQQFLAGSKPSTDPAPLPDLVRGTFFILEHTPVTALGLNRQMHFALGSEEEWHRVGDRLAPKDGWNEILGGRPGMLSLIIQTVMPEGAVFTFRIEPSTQVKNGIYFDANAHFSGLEKDSLNALMEIAHEQWEGTQAYASKVANHILDWASK